MSAPVHGGPDSGPPIAVDFSTNAHPMGPNPWLDERIRCADRSRYPDPGYAALREALGQFHGVAPERVVIGASAIVAADLAYWPFRRLLGANSSLQLDAPWSNEVVQLWSPNKLHGLTGVRAAYLILPATAPRLGRTQLESLAPSWPLGADGVELLAGHTQREATQFLDDTAPTLRAWKTLQDRRLVAAGWKPQVSEMHFGLWQPPVARTSQRAWHAELRLSGIKVRDAQSFGRPAWVRLVTREPQHVEELIAITDRFRVDQADGKLTVPGRPRARPARMR
jgi:histidinol-phosphate aminotransferase